MEDLLAAVLTVAVLVGAVAFAVVLLWLAAAQFGLMRQSAELRRVTARLRRVELYLHKTSRERPEEESEAPPQDEVPAAVEVKEEVESATEPHAEEETETTEPIPTPRAPPFTLPSPERVAVWVGASIGGFAILLGALLGLVTLVQWGLLGPSVRITLALASGMGMWALGALLRRGGHRVVPAALLGSSAGVIYGALFAAHQYELLSALVVFSLMAATSVTLLLTAARHNDRFTAHLALIGGLLTPVLVNTGENRPVAFFGYLTMLLVATLMAATLRAWWDVVLASALGVALLHLGWTTTWLTPDQAPYGLLAALSLTVPFAAAAIFARKSVALEASASAMAVVLPLLALPWLAPITVRFTDPISGLDAPSELGALPWWCAAALLLLPLPALITGRVRGRALTAAAASGTALLLAISFAWLWPLIADVGVAPLLAGSLALLGAVALLYVGNARVALGVAAKPALAGLAITVPLAALTLPPWLAATTPALLLLLGMTLAWGSRQGWAVLSTLVGVSLATLAIAPHIEDVGPLAVAAPAVLGFAVLTLLPILRPWREGAPGPWLTSALAGPLFFLPIMLAWLDAWGWDAMGSLPALMGAVTLVALAVRVRTHANAAHSFTVALLTLSVLLGLTMALPLQVETKWLTLGMALEAGALAALTTRLHHPLIRWSSVVLMAIVGARLLLNPWALGYGETGGWPLLNWTLYTWGLPMLLAFYMAWQLRRTAASGDGLHSVAQRWLPTPVVLLAVLLGFALVNVEVSHAFQFEGPVELSGATLLQGMVRSISWAAFGITVLVGGLLAGSRTMRLVGFGFTLLAAFKVFGFDLFALSGFVRAGSVLGLGFSLVLAAFLFERLVLRRALPEETP